MKAESWIFIFIGIFLGVVTPIYWFSAHEIIGTMALLMSFAFAGMLSVYLVVHSRKMDPRLEDRKDADIIEGAGELGFFPPSSIWPFWCAVVLSVMALGPVYGWWLSLLGGAFGIWALTGWAYEYYRGHYQH